ncbi:MAG: hypothetical protein ACRDKY_05670 [Solirubrobacteraceae bacterium]
MSVRADYESAGSQDVPEEALIAPDGLALTAAGSPPIRLLGSFSTPVALRPQDEEDPEEPEEPNEDPDPPLPAVSTPDVAFQFSPCLTAEMRARVIAAIRAAFGAGADVRMRCVAGTERAGIWLRPLTPTMDDASRDRGLERLALLRGGETFAAFVNASLIRARAQETWNAMPKRLNGDGQADPDGPIHLTSFSVSFEAPDRIVTRIGGYDERPWPDVSFTLTLTDTIGASGGQITCTSGSDLDVDSSWISALTAIFLLTLPPLGVFFLVERIIIASVDAPDVAGGAGRGAAAMIPGEILVAGGVKVVLLYSRAQVVAGGLFAGGSYLVTPRNPQVTVSGPRDVSVEEGDDSLTRSYSARGLVDLLPPLRYRWTADGFVQRPSAQETPVRFDVSDGRVPQILRRDVTVRVTDVDGLTADDDLTVNIHMIEPNDPNDPSDDPICQVRPWLPQCQIGNEV